eukprot:2721834-Amphidinium_carterae.1
MCSLLLLDISGVELLGSERHARCLRGDFRLHGDHAALAWHPEVQRVGLARVFLDNTFCHPMSTPQSHAIQSGTKSSREKTGNFFHTGDSAPCVGVNSVDVTPST